MKTPSGSGGYFGVACGNGYIAALSSSGQGIFYSSDNGDTWNQKTLTYTYNWYKIAYGNNTFMLTAISANSVLTTTDFITVNSNALSTSGYWTDLKYGGSRWCMISGSGGATAGLYSDNNGSTWTPFTLPFGSTWTSLEYSRGVWIATTNLHTSGAISIDNGATWLQGSIINNTFTCSCANDEGVFIASNSNTGPISQSFDGNIWEIKAPSGYLTRAIIKINNEFILIPATGATAYVVATSISSDRYQFLSKEYRTVSASDSSILTKHPQATEITLPTLLTSQTDAQNEADRQLAMRKIRRDYIQASFQQGAITTPNLGDIVQITYPRYGYDAGKLFVVIGLEIDYSTGKITLALWG
jgi:hypothetical protein